MRASACSRRPALLSVLLGLLGLVSPWVCQAESPLARVMPAGELPPDARLGKKRDLYDAYHPWQPPRDKATWEREAEYWRDQVRVGLGLWPAWPKSELKPVVHGKIDREGYTVEKVYFASLPGHYVTGNLYRPTGVTGKRPGVLCPHGHWPNGRFYEAPEAQARQQIESGAEQFEAGARFPLQARMVHLARMGCVVFHYDMVGYADSKVLDHREFADLAGAQWLHTAMGLQTWNSIRSLDFLLTLPEVDAARVAITGSSGGGTQTFLATALDDRFVAAYPAVMVSTGMQGGCICENAPYLRIDTNNIALASLFAPKPMAMSGADDWTIAIESRGLPEMKWIWGLYGKPDHVAAKAWPEFKHNYNQPAREFMYAWFAKHLQMPADTAVVEKPFAPIPVKDLTVFDAEHPVPADALRSDAIRTQLTAMAADQFADLVPQSPGEVAEYRRVVSTAAKVMLGLPPTAGKVSARQLSVAPLSGGGLLTKGLLSREGSPTAVPALVLYPAQSASRAVVWIDPAGKGSLLDADGKPRPAVRALLDRGQIVASVDCLLTGEYLADPAALPGKQVMDDKFYGYTVGYNRPLLTDRVQDILSLVEFLGYQQNLQGVDLVGTGAAGPWVLLAAAMHPEPPQPNGTKTPSRTVVADLGQFRFADLTATSDPMFLPGAHRYGDLAGLAALALPGRLVLHRPHEETAAFLTGFATHANGNVASSPAGLTADAVPALLAAE